MITDKTIAVLSMLATFAAVLVALLMPWWLRWFERRQLRMALKREYENARARLESGLQWDAMPEGVNGVSWLDAHLRILSAPIWHQHQGQAALLLDDGAYQEMKAFYLGISLYGPAISRWESAKTSGDISAQINTEMQMALALLRTQAKRTD